MDLLGAASPSERNRRIAAASKQKKREDDASEKDVKLFAMIGDEDTARIRRRGHTHLVSLQKLNTLTLCAPSEAFDKLWCKCYEYSLSPQTEDADAAAATLTLGHRSACCGARKLPQRTRAGQKQLSHRDG